jgi:hypothetical protein
MTDMFAVPVYFPRHGDSIRIVVLHNGEWRPIFWFQLKKDGSIYLGPRYKYISRLRTGSGTVEGDQQTIQYADGRQVTDPAILSNPHISVHASGLVHAAGGRFFRASLRTLKETQIVCHVLFQHPDSYVGIPVSQIRRRDVCMTYPFDFKRPLSAELYAAPAQGIQPITPPGAVYQVNPVFVYTGLQGTPDLALQLILFHSVEGPWPPDTYLLFPTKQDAPNQ